MKFFHPITLILGLVGVGLLVFVLVRGPSHSLPAVESLANFQTADAPLFLPEDGVPRHRLHQLSAWERVALPRAVRFDAPMGSEHGGLTYNAQPFWEMNEKRGGHHVGDDLNGIGGMNTDLGDPVFASADGLVLYAAEPSEGWGKTVVIGHQAPDDRQLHTMYAHLHRIDVAVGLTVARGDQIGTVGTANGYYPAHLHFELRESDGVDIGAGYTMFELNRLNPTATIEELRGADPDELGPPMIPVALARDEPWNRLELSPEDAAKLGEILGGE